MTYSLQTTKLIWILPCPAQSPITHCQDMFQDNPSEWSSRDCTMTTGALGWLQFLYPKLLRNKPSWHQASKPWDAWVSWLPYATEYPLYGATDLPFFWGKCFGVIYLMEEKTHLQCQCLWGNGWTEQGWSEGTGYFCLITSPFVEPVQWLLSRDIWEQTHRHWVCKPCIFMFYLKGNLIECLKKSFAPRKFHRNWSRHTCVYIKLYAFSFSNIL
jgi:hypothetical protein